MAAADGALALRLIGWIEEVHAQIAKREFMTGKASTKVAAAQKTAQKEFLVG